MADPKFTREQETWINNLIEKTKRELRRESSRASETAETSTGSVFQLKQNLENYVTGLENTISELSSFEELDRGATQIAKAFGTTRDRLGEFKSVLAETIPNMIELGGDAGDVITILQEFGNTLGTAASIGVEAVTELAATSKVTGVETSTLTDKFVNFGVSVYDVAENMKQVVDYTRSIGGNVQEVSDMVVENLGALNVYNFDNGVKGLAKMSAQAARFGIDMRDIFTLADGLFSPEKAIEMAAGLQRLGVTTSSLLDPLRLMDMAQNDPAELQNQIANMTKEFTQLNAETGKFEIKPGSMRRIREIATELGMSKEELSSMALRAADFDRKLNEIEFPDFAASPEDKEMLASMAQMKGGRAVITVRDEETGVSVEKEVQNLTPEDIEKLKISQEDQGKTMEQIAIDQLDTLKRIETGTSAFKERVRFAKAAAAPAQRAYETIGDLQRQIPATLKEAGVSDFKNITEGFSAAFGTLEDFAIKISQGDFEGANASIEKAISSLGTFEENLKTKLNSVADIMKSDEYFKIIKEKYPEVTGVEGKKATETKIETKSDMNMNITLKGENLPPNTDTETLNRVINDLLKSPQFANEIKKSLDNINSGLVVKK